MIKFRCSSLGKLMTNSSKKDEILGKTAKSYIQEFMLEKEFGIRKEFWSKAVDKGNEVEDESIELCNDVLGFNFLYKNEERMRNNWVSGIPDVNTDEILLDVKSSWDATTFPFFDEVVPNKHYYYQMQGYMWLTNKETSLLCYCLIDTPHLMLEDEIRREHWKQNLIEESEEVRQFVEAKHKFDHLPKKQRVKVFQIYRDDEVIEKMKERIEICRDYYYEILEKFKKEQYVG